MATLMKVKVFGRGSWNGTLIPEGVVVSRWTYLASRAGATMSESDPDIGLVVAVRNGVRPPEVPDIPVVVVADSLASSTNPEPMSGLADGSVVVSVSGVPDGAFTCRSGSDARQIVAGDCLSAYSLGRRGGWGFVPRKRGGPAIVDVDGSSGASAYELADSLSGIVGVEVIGPRSGETMRDAVGDHRLVIPCPTPSGDSVSTSFLCDSVGCVLVHPRTVVGFTMSIPSMWISGSFDVQDMGAVTCAELDRAGRIQGASVRNVGGVMSSKAAGFLGDAFDFIVGSGCMLGR